jgi:hypothetical protein
MNLSNLQSCVHIVQSGSRKVDVQIEAVQIFNTCIWYNVHLKIQWVPRQYNTIADDIITFSNTDDWEESTFFLSTSILWGGAHDIDHFATSKYLKTLRFYSLFMNVETKAIALNILKNRSARYNCCACGNLVLSLVGWFQYSSLEYWWITPRICGLLFKFVFWRIICDMQSS